MQTLQNYVFFLNANGTSLNMLPPARARDLQDKNKAAMFRFHPYVLIAQKQIHDPVLQPYILKIDPGSKWTGFAIQRGNEIVFRMELEHRGSVISFDLQKRREFRRSRRSRHLRYRKKRFNRSQLEGWLAPSLLHRVLTVKTWIKRLMQWCPITRIEVEQVRFDMQAMRNPEISGIAYQQGTLLGYEVREYLLEKWNRKCAYCNVKDVPLEIEHIYPKSKGGSDRISNLCLACHACNQQKGNQTVQDFLAGKPDLLRQIQAQTQAPLNDAAAVNATRFAIVQMAKSLCTDVRCWTGGRTKFNRCLQQLEKTHSIDAACVGESGASIVLKTHQALIVTCKGHGSRQARRVNAHGFPAVENPKAIYTHIQTSDIVKLQLTKDRKNVKAGTYTTRVKTPTTKGFEVLINGFRVGIASMNGVTVVQRQDGYSYKVKNDDLF